MRLAVIARYNEDVSWIKDLSFDYLIYNKGEPLERAIDVPNIGREGDTWLRFITECYSDLPDITFFLQGNPFFHRNSVITEINQWTGDSLLYLGADNYASDGNGNPWHPGLPVAQTYKRIFQEERNDFKFAAGAQYGVSKELIINKPKIWWEALYEVYKESELSPWTFERLWAYIFNYKGKQNVPDN